MKKRISGFLEIIQNIQQDLYEVFEQKNSHTRFSNQLVLQILWNYSGFRGSRLINKHEKS